VEFASLFPSHPQLKISFSETALETTYQYPSESSVLEELGPEPEAPSPPSTLATQPDDDEDEEELLLLQPELQGGLRTKALIVGKQGRGRPDGAPWCHGHRGPKGKREGSVVILEAGLTAPQAQPLAGCCSCAPSSLMVLGVELTLRVQISKLRLF
jgi:hypothetical protein